MKANSINQSNIKVLMDIFYAKIRFDKSGLGDIFNNKIGTSDEEWEAHKAKIANFWEGMLLGSGNYAGAPMKAHLELPPFPREFFNNWLNMFKESLDEIYQENIAREILRRAEAIAQRFQYMIYESGYNH